MRSASSRGALYRSTNGGQRWIKTDLGSVYAVVVDPRHPASVYVGTEFDGILKSSDAGRTWRAGRSGLPKLATVTTLAIDPRRPQVVYAGMDGYDGLFKSTNGVVAGATQDWPTTPWTRWRSTRERRRPSTRPSGIPSSPTSAGIAFARSTDGGRSWRVPEYGLRSIGSFAITPLGPATVYAGTSRGVFKSIDRDRGWRASGLQDRGIVSAVLIDPRRATTLYAATWKNGVFRSTNGGRLNQGLPTLEISSLAIASNGRVLYAGTDAGVFDYQLPG